MLVIIVSVIKSQEENNMITRFEDLRLGQQFSCRFDYGYAADRCCFDCVYEVVAINADTRKVKIKEVSNIETVCEGFEDSIALSVDPKPIWCRVHEGVDQDYLTNHNKDICIGLTDDVIIK